MEVVDNFLPKDEFDILRESLESSSFPWYWNNHSVGNDGTPQFFHAFMNREGINSDYFNLLTSKDLLGLVPKEFSKM